MVARADSATVPASPDGLVPVTTILSGCRKAMARKPVIQVTQRTRRWNRLITFRLDGSEERSRKWRGLPISRV